MISFLCFIIGTLIGSVISIILMCAVIVNAEAEKNLKDRKE